MHAWIICIAVEASIAAQPSYVQSRLGCSYQAGLFVQIGLVPDNKTLDMSSNHDTSHWQFGAYKQVTYPSLSSRFCPQAPPAPSVNTSRQHHARPPREAFTSYQGCDITSLLEALSSQHLQFEHGAPLHWGQHTDWTLFRVLLEN